MAESKKRDENLLMNLAHLRKRALDVKFDLDLNEYQPIENIGIGAYGVVCSAIHKRTNDRVAIKKIPNVFDVKDIAKRTYREIKILKHFKHDNIIHIREILKPKETLDVFRDVYVVFDLMESDLHKIIYSKQELTEEHVRYFLYQILRGLKYIHSSHVIHRDLKPSNLLVNEDCQLRIGDFGMARGISSCPVEPNYFMTQYVATRWYRAPEIMLSLIEYGAAVDMWSVGCIFAEMLGRKHLFPGKDAISQIKLIVGTVGSPSDDLLRLCHSPIIKNFFQEMGKKESIPWAKLYPKASKKAIHFLNKMLVLHPKERITVEQALVHPYLNKYHDPDDEPICVPTFNFDFEKEELSVTQIRESIAKEVMEYHQPRTPTLSFNALLRPVPKSADSSDTNSPFFTKVTEPDKSEKDVKSDLDVSAIKKEDDTTTVSPVRDKTKQIIITKTVDVDDEVFKKPLSAKNSDTQIQDGREGVLKVESWDIEMLSAKSEDGKQQMSAMLTEEKPKENREPVKDENNKTISDNTKSLIKAAIKNASFKKRTDSVGDDEKPKPMTAAMRQKEREDKRKKKKERTMQKKMKDVKKNSAEEILTSEDKELLQRWAKMQKVNVPIAPKPQTIGSSGQGQTSGVIGQGQTTTLSDQTSSQTQNNKSEGGDNEGKQTQEYEHSTSQKNVQRGTLDLLQQRILLNANNNNNGDSLNSRPEQSVGQTMFNTGTVEGNKTEIQNITNNQVNIVNEHQQNTSKQDNMPYNHTGGDFSVDFSSVPLGEIDFLALVTSPDLVSLAADNMMPAALNTSITSSHENYYETESLHARRQSGGFSQTSQQQTGIQTHGNQHQFQSDSLQTGHQSGVYPSTSQQIQGTSLQQHGSPHQYHEGDSLQARHQSSGLSVTSQQHGSPHHLSVSPNYPNHTSPPQYYQGHSPGSHHSVSPDLRVSPNVHYQQGTDLFSQSQQQQPAQMYGHTLTAQSTDLPFQGHSMAESRNPANDFLLASTGNQTQNLQSHPSGSQNFLYRPQPLLHGTHGSHSNSNSNSPPSLSINTQQAQMSFQHLFQPVAGPSQPHIAETQVDLIALLSKQLSKSNVGDICPPLALTPRGTGGGYGLGVDLDALMGSTESDNPPEQPSPLSSSILADWMEVTGNMNIDMDALEQELQSPMALSYNDWNLYSS